MKYNLLDSVLYCYLVSIVLNLLYSVDASRKTHYDVWYTTVRISDHQKHSFNGDGGQLAVFSNISVTNVKGKLYEPPADLFSCSGEPNVSALELPREPFVVFLPLGDCPYTQSQIAEQIGAVGIVFHANGISRELTNYHLTLRVVVTLILLTEDELHSLKVTYNFSDAEISITLKQYTGIPTNTHTFYFVVFAFSILVLLSLTWFCITYARRCYDHYTFKRRRNRAQRKALQMIKKLPTKKYNRIKISDSDSLSSVDEPTCAVCLDSFKQNEYIRELPCRHEFHQECIDPWLKTKGTCPLCKYNIVGEQQRNVGATSATVTRTLSSSSDDTRQDTDDDPTLPTVHNQHHQATQEEPRGTRHHDSRRIGLELALAAMV